MWSAPGFLLDLFFPVEIRRGFEVGHALFLGLAIISPLPLSQGFFVNHAPVHLEAGRPQPTVPIPPFFSVSNPQTRDSSSF